MQLDIQNLSKRYGSNYGVKDYSLSIGKGILGLLGPNGAGKSTLLKMIATVSKPTEGVILFNRNNIVKDPNYIRKQLGYLPQNFGVYPNLNAIEFLNYMAALKGIGGPSVKKRIYQLLEGLNLMDAAKKPIGTYSGGMKQRIGIAQALLNDPKMLIFDEPTVGLDPEERVRFRNLISDLANECTIILSSHIVSDIVSIADEVAIMKKGTLITKGYQDDIIAHVAGSVYEIQLPKEAVAAFKKDHTIVSITRKASYAIVRYVGPAVENATPTLPTLEDAYLYLTKN